MGLIDFVKNAGESLHEKAEAFGDKLEAMGDKFSEKVGIGGAKPKKKQAPASTTDDEVGPKLAKVVEKMGVPVEDLEVVIDGDVARVSANTPTQADREKIILAVGNTKGIAQVDDRITPAKPEPEATFYTVVRGDTLSKIAKAQYGDAMKYPVIFEANRPMLENPDKIYPGQVLRIPSQ